MSSFFTLPASQRKRKRAQGPERSEERRGAESKRRGTRDESISGSEASDDEDVADAGDVYEETDEEEDEELRNEDSVSKRIRLAEQYLANTQREVLEDGGFDAAEVDQENLRRRMGDRLKEDTAETRGKLYRFIADELDWSKASHTHFRTDTKAVTGVAVSGQYVYTVTKDRALVKWELPASGSSSRKPKKLLFTRGNKNSSEHHRAAILCVAASQDGKFVATGGADNRLIIWDTATLKPLKVFSGEHRDNGHRDNVMSLAFRRGTNQLFSASKDRTVKIWSLDELAYVETLFGHQDEVVDVSALTKETCITVGARDRTARFWKVVEESQLVFRGGGAGVKSRQSRDKDSGADAPPQEKAYHEGSMDRVACIDEETFITGSDNGALSLWNIHKKKPVFTYPLAHGLDPPLPLSLRSAEMDPTQALDAEGPMENDPQPRWVTALRAIPFSNVFVTGSWDGYVRAWRLSQDKRRIEPLGALGRVEGGIRTVFKDDEEVDGEPSTASDFVKPAPGVVNDLDILDRGDRGKEGMVVVAALGKEQRLGRWDVHGGKNGAVLFEIPRTALESEDQAESAADEDDAEGFAGFD